MKYGIMNSVLRKSWEESFAEASQLGFDGVELTGVGEGSKLWSEEGAEEINQLAAKSGVEVPSVTLSWPYTLADPLASRRKVAQDVIEETIRACKTLGAWVILVPFFGAQELTPKQATSDVFINELSECAKTAEENQVYLALETTLGAEDLLKIMKAVSSPFVKVYFDVGNAVWWKHEPVSLEIRKLKDQIIQIHIKDTKNGPGDVHLGKGRVDFASVSEAIKDIGYERYLVLETPATDEPEEAAARNLQYLKKYIT